MSKKSNNMKTIICELQKGTEKSKDRWIGTKTGWKFYVHDEEKENLISKIMILVEVHPTRQKNGLSGFKLNIGISDDRKKATETGRYENDEVGTERKITEINKDIEMYNQLCVGRGNTEAIDLYISKDKNNVDTIIELKTNKGNTPLYAFVETIKNYCLLKKINKNQNPKELILLAPKDYYKEYAKHENSIREFYRTIEKFNTENKNTTKFFVYALETIDDETNLKRDNWKRLFVDDWLRL